MCVCVRAQVCTLYADALSSVSLNSHVTWPRRAIDDVIGRPDFNTSPKEMYFPLRPAGPAPTTCYRTNQIRKQIKERAQNESSLDYFTAIGQALSMAQKCRQNIPIFDFVRPTERMKYFCETNPNNLRPQDLEYCRRQRNDAEGCSRYNVERFRQRELDESLQREQDRADYRNMANFNYHQECKDRETEKSRVAEQKQRLNSELLEQIALKDYVAHIQLEGEKRDEEKRQMYNREIDERGVVQEMNKKGAHRKHNDITKLKPGLTSKVNPDYRPEDMEYFRKQKQETEACSQYNFKQFRQRELDKVLQREQDRAFYRNMANFNYQQECKDRETEKSRVAEQKQRLNSELLEQIALKDYVAHIQLEGEKRDEEKRQMYNREIDERGVVQEMNKKGAHRKYNDITKLKPGLTSKVNPDYRPEDMEYFRKQKQETEACSQYNFEQFRQRELDKVLQREQDRAFYRNMANFNYGQECKDQETEKSRVAEQKQRLNSELLEQIALKDYVAHIQLEGEKRDEEKRQMYNREIDERGVVQEMNKKGAHRKYTDITELKPDLTSKVNPDYRPEDMEYFRKQKQETEACSQYNFEQFRQRELDKVLQREQDRADYRNMANFNYGQECKDQETEKSRVAEQKQRLNSELLEQIALKDYVAHIQLEGEKRDEEKRQMYNREIDERGVVQEMNKKGAHRKHNDITKLKPGLTSKVNPDYRPEDMEYFRKQKQETEACSQYNFEQFRQRELDKVLQREQDRADYRNMANFNYGQECKDQETEKSRVAKQKQRLNSELLEQIALKDYVAHIQLEGEKRDEEKRQMYNREIDERGVVQEMNKKGAHRKYTDITELKPGLTSKVNPDYRPEDMEYFRKQKQETEACSQYNFEQFRQRELDKVLQREQDRADYRNMANFNYGQECKDQETEKSRVAEQKQRLNSELLEQIALKDYVAHIQLEGEKRDEEKRQMYNREIDERGVVQAMNKKGARRKYNDITELKPDLTSKVNPDYRPEDCQPHVDQDPKHLSPQMAETSRPKRCQKGEAKGKVKRTKHRQEQLRLEKIRDDEIGKMLKNMIRREHDEFLKGKNDKQKEINAIRNTDMKNQCRNYTDAKSQQVASEKAPSIKESQMPPLTDVKRMKRGFKQAQETQARIDGNLSDLQKILMED
nr:trichohyalin-like [Nothobranchius furzeri]